MVGSGRISMVGLVDKKTPVAEHHIPVLLDEVLDALQPHEGGVYVDGTVGAGGHASAVLRAAGPTALLLGIDADPSALEIAAETLAPFGPRAVLREGSFRHLLEIAERTGIERADGVLLDLGISSMQLDRPGRGFSFNDDSPLDMRFSPQQQVSAADLVNSCPEQALADLIYRLGEEPLSRRIARAIVAHRPIDTAAQLARVVQQAVPRRGRTHPATQLFQSLRIAVNDELEALREVLPQALALLSPGGRLAVISFHSLEDRIVKNWMDTEAKGCICPPEAPLCVCGHSPMLRRVTRHPIRPSKAEVQANPRSRSAKLRVAEKL